MDPPQAVKDKGFLHTLGPGLVTGASDDDPSGIATYSQAGAQFGMGMLWLMPFAFPLMAGIQETCADLGRVTGRGIAGNLRRFYPKQLLFLMVMLVAISNAINIGADIGAMGDAVTLLIGGPRFLWAAILASSMGFIDSSVTAIAIPAIRAALDASLPQAQWIAQYIFRNRGIDE